MLDCTSENNRARAIDTDVIPCTSVPTTPPSPDADVDLDSCLEQDTTRMIIN